MPFPTSIDDFKKMAGSAMDSASNAYKTVADNYEKGGVTGVATGIRDAIFGKEDGENLSNTVTDLGEAAANGKLGDKVLGMASEEFSKHPFGRPSFPKYKAIPHASYPSNILGPNCEVDRALTFKAFQYRTDFANPSTKSDPVKSDTVWSCFLPMPVINESESHKYDEYHSTGAGIGSGQVAKGFQDGKLTDVMKGMGDMAKGIGVSGAWNLGQAKMGNEFSLMRRDFFGGKTLDPRNSIMYQSSALKMYSFQYYMVARSTRESDCINAIVNGFKYCARPTRMNGIAGIDGVPFLAHPHLWNIKIEESASIKDRGKFYAGSQTFLPKIGVCVLTDISVDYGDPSKGPIFFRDTGAPFEVVLSLSFCELFQAVNEG